MDSLASESLFNLPLCGFLEGGQWGPLPSTAPGLDLSFQSESEGRS